MFGLLIIILVWLIAPWAGIFVTGYIIYNYFKNESSKIELKLPDKLKISLKPQRTADELLLYKNCTVEIYREPFGEIVRIITPIGRDLGIEFESVSKAIANIDAHIK